MEKATQYIQNRIILLQHLVQNFRANPNEANLNSANKLIKKEIKAVDNNKIMMLMATSINLGRKLSIRLSILGLRILTNG